MKRISLFAVGAALAVSASAGLQGLSHKIERIVGDENVGVAIITCNGDSMVMRGDDRYDMASVMKFHQAAALARTMDYDSIMGGMVTVEATDLAKDTWSPLRASAPATPFDIATVSLLDYSLMMSDNNAADILFDRFLSPAQTDSVLRAEGMAAQFALRHTEKEMHADSTALGNWTTPADAASCIYRFFTADTTASATLVKAIMARDTPFGTKRIVAGVTAGAAKVFHKTGTGFNGPNGTPTAINDLAFISYPRPGGYGCYALAVFVKDFSGTAEQGEAMIADISEAVWNAIIVDEFVAMNNASTAGPRTSPTSGRDPKREKQQLGEILFDIASSIIYEAIDSKLSGDN